MASYIWPPTLPQKVAAGSYSSSSSVSVLRTSMDAGAPKQRYIGRKPQPMTVSFYMTTAQLAVLESFLQNDIKGVKPFEFPHPETGVTVDVRIVPSEDGHYSKSYIGPGQWGVSMKLEVLP